MGTFEGLSFAESRVGGGFFLLSSFAIRGCTLETGRGFIPIEHRGMGLEIRQGELFFFWDEPMVAYRSAFDTEGYPPALVGVQVESGCPLTRGRAFRPSDGA